MKPVSRTSRMPTGRESHSPTDAGNGAPAAGRPWFLVWFLPLLCMLVAAVGTFLLFEYVILSKVPSALLGKWVVTEGEQEGATLEFLRDGTMIGVVNMNGKEGHIKAKVWVEDQTLWSSTRNPFTGQDDTDKQTIVTLTDTHLVLEDKSGTVMKLERVRLGGESPQER